MSKIEKKKNDEKINLELIELVVKMSKKGLKKGLVETKMLPVNFP